MHVLVGCEVKDPSPTRESLYVCTFDAKTERLSVVNGIRAMPKTAYLVTDPERQLVYAVGSEAGQAGAAASYRFDAQRQMLIPMNQRSTLGANPNYASMTHTGGLLMAVNFAGGSVSLLPIEASGRLGEVIDQIHYEGSGPVPGAQSSSHPHCIAASRNNQYVIVTDLGTDRVHVYKLDEANGRLWEHSRYSAEPGSGPRHFLFHAALPAVYLIYELSNTIGVFSFDDREGILKLVQTVPTLPAGYEGQSKCADLKLSPCGRYLYGTNRGHDSIAAYKLEKDGLLGLVEIVSSYGRKPRSLAFSPDGSHLLSANEGSNDVVVFAVDPQSGKLHYKSRLEMPSSPINVTFLV